MEWKWKKQNNRLEALKRSVINDIENIVGDGEMDLRKGMEFRSPVADSIGVIKKLSKSLFGN